MIITPAPPAVCTDTVVRAIRAHRLPGQYVHVCNELAEPLAPVVVASEGTGWPEHQHRYVLELVADDVSGWFGPISEAVLTLVRDNYATGILGHDALAYRQIKDRSVSGRHHAGAHTMQARSALELACWDLASRATGLPVTSLLGGAARTTVPLYASALGLDVRHPAAPEAARWIADAGFWGQKWALPAALLDAGPAAVDAHLRRIRAAVPEMRIMVDGLGRCRLDQAVALMPVLAGLQLTWAEELVESSGPAWRSLRSHAHGVPIAAGEHAYDHDEQNRLLGEGLVDVWQPDVAWCGGLGRALHTVTVAADLGIAAFPHGGSLLAALALAGTCSPRMVPAIEYHLTVEPLRQQIFASPVQPHAGLLPVRSGPGLADYAPIAGTLPILIGTEK